METPKIARDKTEKQKLTLGIDRGIIESQSNWNQYFSNY